MESRLGISLMIAALGAVGCDAKPAPAGDALAPSTGAQTLDDSLNSKSVQAGGAVQNGASVVGSAVKGSLGIQGGVAVSSKIGKIGSQMGAGTGGAPTQFQGVTTLGGTGGALSTGPAAAK